VAAECFGAVMEAAQSRAGLRFSSKNVNCNGSWPAAAESPRAIATVAKELRACAVPASTIGIFEVVGWTARKSVTPIT
jgi:hypothetical protein